MRDRLALEGVLWLAVLSALLLAGIVVIMNTYGKRLVVEESKRRIEEAGDRRVAELGRQTTEIAALARTLAKTAARLPKDDATFSTYLPEILDFGGNRAVAGGGYWPEPGAFTPGVERSSLFWGRDANGRLRLEPGYNGAGPGYHNEEWYVTAKHRREGSVAWSRAFTDPYTLVPMVACTVGVFEDGRFVGNASVDLALSSLSDLLASWQQTFGGYAFLLDRNNRFLTFPKLDLVTTRGFDEKGNRPENFVTTADLAKNDARFLPVARAVEAMDREILSRARSTRGYDAKLAEILDGESYAIDRKEAESIAAIQVDPLSRRGLRGQLVSTFDVPEDLVTGQPSIAFLFHVPDSYWKLVFVTPVASAEAVATRISRLLVLALGAIILPILALAYLFLNRRLIRPVTGLAATASRVRDGDLEARAAIAGSDELAALAHSFNTMVERLRSNAASLEATNAELGRSLAMTDTIMGTVAEGLFLLDPELKIAPKYSAALRRILGEQDLAGADFLDLLRRITPEKLHDLTARFLKLLFNPSKTDSVIAKINPLKEIEAAFPGERGQLEQKFLTFTFDRVKEEGEIRQAMVTVSDVTSRVELARELATSKERMERQAQLLLSIMHVEPEMLRDFIDGAHGELEAANRLLRSEHAEAKTPAERQALFRKLADQIFRSVHTIKGTASMLQIDYFTQEAHRFEERLADLRRRPRLAGDDFLPIVLELSEMVDSLNEIRSVIHRFSEIQRAEGVKNDADALAAVLLRFVGELADGQAKKARFSARIAGSGKIPFRYKAPLRNALAQLVRNAMIHGVEVPAERLAAGKPETAEVTFSVRSRDDGRLEVALRDDGRGLDYARIVERAKELAKTEPDLLERLIDRAQNRWKASALDELIFHPGFSTADAVSVDAGRGMGLAAVRSLLAELDGTIEVRHRTGQFCEFLIVLPAA